jgi:hypothetical protein
MRFRATLQRVVGAGRFDTDYWYEMDLPDLDTASDIMGLASEMSGFSNALLFAALNDKSLYPHDGFRFVYRSIDSAKAKQIEDLGRDMLDSLLKEVRRDNEKLTDSPDREVKR